MSETHLVVFIEEDTPFLRPQRGQLGVTGAALGFFTGCGFLRGVCGRRRGLCPAR